MNSTTNITAQPRRDEDLARVEIAVQATIFALAVFGNLAVLLVLGCHARKKKLTRMNLLILHLSLADLFDIGNNA